MRTIKFRAKTVNTNEWVESMTISMGTIKRKRNNFFFELDENKWVGVIKETVGEFTGRKDNFDNELFEFDIIERLIQDFQGVNPPSKYIQIVCFRNAGFVAIDVSKYKENNPPDWENLEDYFLHSIRKIGNIFDNAELISEL
jgi:hypothetical protein